MPRPKVVRHRRALKAGFGLLLLSLLGAILARLYLMRAVPPSSGKIPPLSAKAADDRAAARAD